MYYGIEAGEAQNDVTHLAGNEKPKKKTIYLNLNNDRVGWCAD